MKKLYFLAAALSLSVWGADGCSTADDDIDPSPDVTTLMDSAWARYIAHDYDSASVLFTKAIALNAYEPEAHMGKGFADAKQGLYSDAHGSFSVCPTLGGANTITETLGADTVQWDTANPGNARVDTSGGWLSTYGIWRFQIDTAGIGKILGLTSFKQSFNDLDIVGFDDNGWVYVRDTALPFVHWVGDTTDTAAMKTNIISWSLSYDSQVQVTAITWMSYGGDLGTYVGEASNLVQGIIRGRAALLAAYSDTLRDIVVTALQYTLSNDMKLLLAYGFFLNGYNGNCVELLNGINAGFPYGGWSINTPADFAWAMDVDNTDLILEELEKQLGQ